MAPGAQAQSVMPTAPSYLTASVSGTTVNLNWGSVATATHYNVLRAASPSTDYTYHVCSTVGSNSTNCSDSTVISGQTYTYRVEACIEVNGCSGAGNNQWAYSAAVTIDSSGGTCTALWLNINNYQTSYTVGEVVNYSWTCTSGATTPFRVGIQLLKPDGVTLPPLNEFYGTKLSLSYSFQVPADYASGTYTFQACLNQTSGAICNQIAASASFNVSAASGSYAAPVNVIAARSGSSIYLTWTPPAIAPPFYKIERSVNGTAYTVLANSVTGVTYSDSSTLTSGNYYTYKVYACSSVSTCSTTGGQSNTIAYLATSGGDVDGNTPTPPVPGLPIGPAITSVGTAVSFYAILYDQISAGARLYMQEQAVFDWGDGTMSETAFISPEVSGTPSPAVSHVWRAAGTYFVKAKAKNSRGLESGWSGNFTIAVSGGINQLPAMPTNLRVASATAAGIFLQWNDNATNEDKFTVERKLSTVVDWSAPLIVQLPGANLTSYNDTAVISGISYDYRVQACLSGTGCSAYTYLFGVTVGTAPPALIAQAVTVQILGGSIVPSGMVAFVKDGSAISAYFNNSSSATVSLLPGTYDIQPAFAGINSAEVNLSGTLVNERRLYMSTTPITINVSLPMRLAVGVTVKNSAGQALERARINVGIGGKTTYAAADTDGSGVAWLQLPPGTYQGLVTKSGYLSKTFTLPVSTAATDLSLTLEALPVIVSGKILAGTAPQPFAVVRAVNTDNGSVIVVSANEAGFYSMPLKAGSWRMSAIADGYNEGDGGIITLTNTGQTKDITLGSAVSLVSTSANIVPNVSVTVAAAELGVTVGLPANALGSGGPATLTIRASSHTVPTATAAPLRGSVRDVFVATAGVQVTSLNSAATLEFSYTDADVTAAGITANDISNLKLAFWDETRSDWQVIDSAVDIGNKKVRGSITHFTLFAIVLPFLAQPASAQQPIAPAPANPATVATNERAAQFAAIVAEGTKVYVSTPDSLAAWVKMERNTALELKYATEIVSKVVGQDSVTSGLKSMLINFVTYGTPSTVHLGAGERAGVVASFKAAYGHLPNSEYEWQEVLKIANGRWPGTLLPPREEAMKAIFSKIYLREAVVTQANDSAALAIMAYGLRSAKRNLKSEAAALASFKAVYGRAPVDASDWDAVRAIAYSGAKR